MLGVFVDYVVPFLTPVVVWFGLFREKAPKLVRWLAMCLALLAAVLQVRTTIVGKHDALVASAIGKLGQAPGHALFGPGTPAKLQIGDGGAVIVGTLIDSFPLVRLLGEQSFTIDRRNDSLFVSCLVRDISGRIVGEVVDNEWRVTSNAYDRNFSKNAFELRDAEGDVVLQVVIEPDRVKMQGILWGRRDAGLLFGYLENEGPMLVWMDKAAGRPGSRLVPLFKYPSSTHLGEMDREAGGARLYMERRP